MSDLLVSDAPWKDYRLEMLSANVFSTSRIWLSLGPEAVETPGRGSRRHQYLTCEEEEQFLAPFFAQAENGEIATVAQIQDAFEERVGHEVDESTIYRLLSRHGWRKLMPHPKHPKTDPHVQEQFKASFSAQVEAAVVTREIGDERPVLIMVQREKHFRNRIFPSLTLVTDILCQGLNALVDDTERLRSLTSFPHLKAVI